MLGKRRCSQQQMKPGVRWERKGGPPAEPITGTTCRWGSGEEPRWERGRGSLAWVRVPRVRPGSGAVPGGAVSSLLGGVHLWSH